MIKNTTLNLNNIGITLTFLGNIVYKYLTKIKELL